MYAWVRGGWINYSLSVDLFHTLTNVVVALTRRVVYLTFHARWSSNESWDYSIKSGSKKCETFLFNSHGYRVVSWLLLTSQSTFGVHFWGKFNYFLRDLMIPTVNKSQLNFCDFFSTKFPRAKRAKSSAGYKSKWKKIIIFLLNFLSSSTVS